MMAAAFQGVVSLTATLSSPLAISLTATLAAPLAAALAAPLDRVDRRAVVLLLSDVHRHHSPRLLVAVDGEQSVPLPTACS